MGDPELRQGMRVKTVPRLHSTDGLLVHQKHLAARDNNKVGTLINWVPGHGGDVWFVEHEDSSIAAYSFTEFVTLP